MPKKPKWWKRLLAWLNIKIVTGPDKDFEENVKIGVKGKVTF